MSEADVFHMLIMQRREQREKQQQQEQRVDLYNVVWEWEARERERDLYPLPITPMTHALLRDVGLLKYYEEATSLKGHSRVVGASDPSMGCPSTGFSCGSGSVVPSH
jgi:hypothetical protein